MTRFQLGMQPDFLLMFDEDYSLKYSIAAEKMGFEYVWHADHFFPFQPSFTHVFFAWEVLATIAAKTNKVKVGPAATSPIGGRYHPMLIAQAAATMDRLFPGRFVLAVGAGEAINETRFMGRWPKWEERMGRLLEGVDLIKKLWTEESPFDFEGQYFKVPQAMLYLRPKNEIPIYMSAFGVKAAVVAGKHADRFITEGTVEAVRDVIFPKFQEGARSVGRDPDKVEKAVLTDFATGPRDKIVEKVRRIAGGGYAKGTYDTSDPAAIAARGDSITDEQILEHIYLYQKSDEVIDVLERYRKAGATQVIISEFGEDPEHAMKVYPKVTEYYREKTTG